MHYLNRWDILSHHTSRYSFRYAQTKAFHSSSWSFVNSFVIYGNWQLKRSEQKNNVDEFIYLFFAGIFPLHCFCFVRQLLTNLWNLCELLFPLDVGKCVKINSFCVTGGVLLMKLIDVHCKVYNRSTMCNCWVNIIMKTFDQR